MRTWAYHFGMPDVCHQIAAAATVSTQACGKTNAKTGDSSNRVRPTIDTIKRDYILQSVDRLHGYPGEIDPECPCERRQRH